MANMLTDGALYVLKCNDRASTAKRFMRPQDDGHTVLPLVFPPRDVVKLFVIGVLEQVMNGPVHACFIAANACCPDLIPIRVYRR